MPATPDVDTNRSHLNYHLVEPRHKYYAEIQSRIEQAQRKNPKFKVRRGQCEVHRHHRHRPHRTI